MIYKTNFKTITDSTFDLRYRSKCFSSRGQQQRCSICRKDDQHRHKTCLYRILRPGWLQKHSPALKLQMFFSQQGSGKTDLASKVTSKIDTSKELNVSYNNYQCIYVEIRTSKQEGANDAIPHDTQVSVIRVLILSFWY